MSSMHRRGSVDCRRGRLGRWIDSLRLHASTLSEERQGRIAFTREREQFAWFAENFAARFLAFHQLHPVRRYDRELGPVELLFQSVKDVVVDGAFSPQGSELGALGGDVLSA